MDTAILQVLLNFGATGVVIALIILQILVPYPYVKKLEKLLEVRITENEVLRQTNKDALEASAQANQMIGVLKSIAQEKQEQKEEHKGGANF